MLHLYDMNYSYFKINCLFSISYDKDLWHEDFSRLYISNKFIQNEVVNYDYI